MTIEIFGGGFANKGAELMLRTTVERLRARQPQVRLAVDPEPNSPYELRSKLGLSHIFPTLSIFPPNVRGLLIRSPLLAAVCSNASRFLLPAKADQMLGLVDRRSTDGFVDISGYAFGDGFHSLKCKNAAIRTRVYAKQNKPVIFMPQMFGPFTKPKMLGYFRECCDNATRIYAREQASFDAVRQVIGDDPKLKIAPDITIFSSPGRDIETDRDGAPYGVIVPNERMFDQGKEEWGDTYVARLVAAGKQMHQHGIHLAIVIHSNDAGDDALARQLVRELKSELGEDVTLFTHSDPFVLKHFIAGAQLLVGSRFHSLVAALSSGVPGVALGWAHKYDMLASDFGVPELIHHGADDPNHLLELVDKLCNADHNQMLRARLRSQREAMQSASDAMWEDVFNLLSMTDSQP